LRILFAGSSPGGEPALDIAAEKERLQGALQALRSEGRVVLDTLEGRATVEALQDALRSGYRVFHFSGHGYAGGLMLEYDDGTLHRVSADALAILLGDSGVGLAVFNACDTGAQPGGLFAGVAPALVRTGLPAVVAMQAPMPDASAGTFSRNLYAALADGWPLDAAVTEGRKALALAAGLDRPDWAIPVLYLRAPDGVLWALKDEGEAGAGVSRGGESGDVYGEITVSGGVVGSIGGRGHRIQQAGGTAPGAVPGPDADLAVLRDLLLNAFSAADLRRLVLYTAKRGLRPLGREFSDNDGLAVMVDKTIQYCQTRDLLPDLLQEVARANPRQYARYERHLRSRDQ
jgi:hypothetical protein